LTWVYVVVKTAMFDRSDVGTPVRVFSDPKAAEQWIDERGDRYELVAAKMDES
jgi:hypothetical protein